MFGKSTFDKIKEAFSNAKMVVITIAFIGSSIIGGYTVVSEHFITRLHADQLIQEVETKLSELKKHTQSNKKMLVEMRLIRMEEKIARGETLTPTEQRVYDRLKKDYDVIMNEL